MKFLKSVWMVIQFGGTIYILNSVSEKTILIGIVVGIQIYAYLKPKEDECQE